MDQKPIDVWAEGNAYEPYVGRWSRLIAEEFLRWLDITGGADWLDVGCGTGALTQTIIKIAEPRTITAIDRSEHFISYAHNQLRDGRVTFKVDDAQSLSLADAACDCAVSGLVLNFVPQPEQAIAEMARITRPGGVVAAYVWDYAGKMQFMRYFWNAAAALDPAARDLDEGRRFPLCQPHALAEGFRKVGLQRVETRAIDINTNFRDFDDFWTPFLGGQGPAPSYTMSLTDERRTALRDRIHVGLPFALDGSVPLVARAWAVRGYR